LTDAVAFGLPLNEFMRLLYKPDSQAVEFSRVEMRNFEASKQRINFALQA
jgi:hypothetical protein